MEKQTDKHLLCTDHVKEMIDWLAFFGKSESGGVTRLLYSEPWKQAQGALKIKMDQAGFYTYFDSVGNLFGRLQGTEKNGKTILTGSHIDTVIEGGKYDGAYGVAASFLAAKKLRQVYGIPKKTIEVVSLCEEEGSRFPLAFWGSRNITGEYSLNDVRELQDPDGIQFLEAMRQAGFSPEDYSVPMRRDIDRFVEIHIEQGIVLERNNQNIGIVTHIVGQRRFTIEISGESNHAGTTPMQYRRDAISQTADFISYVTKKAKAADSNLVATVGKISVKPNVSNVIAGEAEFTLDIRHHQETVLDSFCKDIFEYLTNAALASNVTISITKWMDVKPVELDLKLNKWISEMAVEKNISFQEIISGAGHDAQVFGTFCPTSLLFVPSKNGISHSPKEFTSVGDLEKGVEVLSELLYKLAY